MMELLTCLSHSEDFSDTKVGEYTGQFSIVKVPHEVLVQSVHLIHVKHTILHVNFIIGQIPKHTCFFEVLSCFYSGYLCVLKVLLNESKFKVWELPCLIVDAGFEILESFPL